MMKLLVVLVLVLATVGTAWAQLRGIEGLVTARLITTWMAEGTEIQAAYLNGIKAVFFMGGSEQWAETYLCGAPPSKCYEVGALLKGLETAP